MSSDSHTLADGSNFFSLNKNIAEEYLFQKSQIDYKAEKNMENFTLFNNSVSPNEPIKF